MQLLKMSCKNLSSYKTEVHPENILKNIKHLEVKKLEI